MSKFSGIKFSVLDKKKGRNIVTKNYTEKSIILKYPCENNYECTPYRVDLPKGTYKFELWGAQGGDARYANTNNVVLNSGGKGAYVSGRILLEGIHTFYFFIGGRGENQEKNGTYVSKGGYNGGGNGGVDLQDGVWPESSSGGGGSTDVRLYPDDSLKALKSRLIVAGAGAGKVSDDKSTQLCSNAVKLAGTNQTKYTFEGTQTTGLFGKGQDGLSFGRPEYFYGGSTGGGGSGYYGGTSFIEGNASCEISGSGGSSYISGYQGCNSVLNDDSYPPAHSGDPMHYSNIFFEDPMMKSFLDTDFFDPYGKEERGHHGNGVAKITIIEIHGKLIQCTITRCRKSIGIISLMLIVSFS